MPSKEAKLLSQISSVWAHHYTLWKCDWLAISGKFLVNKFDTRAFETYQLYVAWKPSDLPLKNASMYMSMTPVFFCSIDKSSQIHPLQWQQSAENLQYFPHCSKGKLFNFMIFFKLTGSVWSDWSIFVGISKMCVGNDKWTSFIHLIGVGFLVIWSCLLINFAIQWGENSKFLNCAWFNLRNWPFCLFFLIRSVSYAFGFPQINLIYAANHF